MKVKSLPHNLIPEIGWPENLVEHQLQIMAGGGVAVEVERAGGLEDAVKLYQPDGHHHQISHDIVVTDSIVQSADELAHL